MEPLAPESLYDLHMEACATAIRSFCRAEGITQAHLARLLGVTPVHLSYVLNQQRMPGRRFEEGIERARGLPSELKEALLEHLWAAQRYRDEEAAEWVRRAGELPLAGLLPAIEDEYALSGRGDIPPEQARRIHQRVNRRCADLSSRLAYARQDPLAYVRLCIMRSEVGCVLNRLHDSLEAVLLAERVSATAGGNESRSRVLEFYAPATDALRVKGVVYYNLHLYQQAYEACLQLEAQSPDVRQRPDIWLPHIVRDKLKAMAHTARFSIREAETCAQQGRERSASAVYPAAVAEDLCLLIDLSLARCYVAHGSRNSLAKAERMLMDYLPAVRPTEGGAITPMHRVMFFKALAEVEEALRGCGPGAQGNGEVRSALRAAVQIARRAGLHNQLEKMRTRYGALLNESGEPAGH